MRIAKKLQQLFSLISLRWCVLLANFSLCAPPLFHLGDGKQDREEHLDITKRRGEGGLRTHSAINQPRAKKGR